MSLLFRHAAFEGYRAVVEDPSICRHIAFGLLSLQDGQIYREDTAGREVCIILLNGLVSTTVDASEKGDMGPRSTVFDGKPYSLYVPKESDLELRSRGPSFLAVSRAPARSKREPRIIQPQDVKCRTVGRWNWKRSVCDIMGNDSTVPETLIVGETLNPPGNWSSAPPHKHDVDDLPRESRLEEVYFYKLRPPQGFGLQRIYTEGGDLDEAYVVRDGDTMAIPRGYHPVVAAPGYSLYYLWVLAGEKRVMKPRDDGSHSWLKDCEPIISQMEG